MDLVIIESPFAGETQAIRDRNIIYARRALLHSLQLSEAPMVSHLLYTQVLDDNIPEQRQWGIDAGLEWRAKAEYSVVYRDYGISKGMQYGIEAAQRAGLQIEYRIIGPNIELDEVHAKTPSQTETPATGIGS